MRTHPITILVIDEHKEIARLFANALWRPTTRFASSKPAAARRP